MELSKNCIHCGAAFQVTKSGMKRKFCSVDCANAAQTKSERREITCEFCAAKFTARADHGVFPRFCSRECFKGKALKPEPKECASCGGVFMASKTISGKSDDGLRIYCSNKCRHEGLKTAIEMNCLQCGATFIKQQSKIKIGREDGCCSKKCKEKYYVGALSPAFKGGKYESKHAGHGFTYLERPGYVGKHIQNHRLAASRYLGRPIERGEVVIHINKQKMDDRMENLFVCASMSEYAKIRSGSLPWPTKTNIMDNQT